MIINYVTSYNARSMKVLNKNMINGISKDFKIHKDASKRQSLHTNFEWQLFVGASCKKIFV